MDDSSKIGESTDAIVTDESPVDDRDVQAGQRWAAVFFNYDFPQIFLLICKNKYIKMHFII